MSSSRSASEPPIFKYVLLKLASACNIACTYCYWFRDSTVLTKPKTLGLDVEEQFLLKLRRHIQKYELDYFSILFHGGEPLLFGKERFESLVVKLQNIQRQLGFELRLAITTNGMLIDDDWARILGDNEVNVTLSIDGPREIHDARRLDFQRHGTFDRVVPALYLLRRHGVEPGVLSVCNPETDAEVICRFFDSLGVRSFDILVPDATHEDRPPSIGRYYRRLFDYWLDHLADRNVEIRYIRSILLGLLGGESHSESIGFGPITTVTLLTDCSLEPLDVIRIAGDASTSTCFSIFTHELQDIESDPLWREVWQASTRLAPQCLSCPYQQACGGGHIASRWSTANRWNNPSVYCEDIKEIMGHAWKRVVQDLYIETAEGPIPLTQAYESSKGAASSVFTKPDD